MIHHELLKGQVLRDISLVDIEVDSFIEAVATSLVLSKAAPLV